MKILFFIEEYEMGDSEEDFSSETINEKSSSYKIDIESIERYIEILNTKNLSPNGIENILDRIRRQTRLLSHQEMFDNDVINSFNIFVKFSCGFMQNKDENIHNKIILILYEVSIIPDVIPVVKNNCFNYLKKIFDEGNRYYYLIHLLNICGYFKNLIEEIKAAIDNKGTRLIDVFLNFDFNTSNIKSKKWDMIEYFIDKKEKLNKEEDKTLIGRIQKIIAKIEQIK